MGKRELAALLSLSFKCLMIVVWFFLAVPFVCLQFVIVFSTVYEPRHEVSNTVICATRSVKRDIASCLNIL